MNDAFGTFLIINVENYYDAIFFSVPLYGMVLSSVIFIYIIPFCYCHIQERRLVEICLLLSPSYFAIFSAEVIGFFYTFFVRISAKTEI